MNRRILILPTGHTDKNGGIERHCEALKNLFVEDEDLDFIDSIPLKIKEIPYIKKKYYDPKDLRSKLSAVNFDVLHVHGYLHPAISQAFKIGLECDKKIIYTPHFHPFKHLRYPILGRVGFNFFIMPYFDKLDTIITLNTEDTLFFRKYNNNVKMLPHWSLYNARERSVSVNRKKNQILFVGRNDSNKGIDYLYHLPYNKYEVHCVTNGVVKRKDFIQHINVTDEELRFLYESSSLLVVPSRYEAFSLVSLEALTCEVPVLMSNNVRIHDYLHGVNGVNVFNYGNISQFIDLIDIAIKQPVDSEKVNNIFNKEKIKCEYKKIYLNR